jgi:hypothetical protein
MRLKKVSVDFLAGTTGYNEGRGRTRKDGLTPAKASVGKVLFPRQSGRVRNQPIGVPNALSGKQLNENKL